MLYVSCSREEVWTIDVGRRRLVESRLDLGALHDPRDGRLEASTDVGAIARISGVPVMDATRIERALPASLNEEIALPGISRIRHLAKCTHLFKESTEELRSEEAFEFSLGGTTPGTMTLSRGELPLASSMAETLLASANAESDADWRRLPIVFRRGTGGVLLHEAIGHRAASSHPPFPWPSWLQVVDDPDGLMRLDDTGTAAAPSNLISGAPLSTRRRESFRDPAIPRMTRLAVTTGLGSGPLPIPRIEILEVSGGHYDELNDAVELTVAAAVLIGPALHPVRPFTLSCLAPVFALALDGASGPPVTRTVVCYDEGQRILAASTSPDLIVRFDRT